MAQTRVKPQGVIFQIKIILRGSHPAIWRRIEVHGDTPLDKLHGVIQPAMGWTNAHLHRFIMQGQNYAIPDRDDQSPSKPEDERNFTLQDLANQEGTHFAYEYDFGDNWQHELIVEKTHFAKAGKRYPRCLEGEGACPPEDVGGIAGYEHFLEAMADPRHPEHQEYRDWIGGDFDPTRFDVDRINNILRKFA